LKKNNNYDIIKLYYVSFLLILHQFRKTLMHKLNQYLTSHPLIAAIRNDFDFKYALNSKINVFFMLSGDILNLDQIMKDARANNKIIFLHIDLIKGVGKDREGIIYLARKKLCNGILTTKYNLIKIAKEEGLIAIQRLFLLDSASLKTGEHLLNNIQPDAVEILPGVAAPYFIENISKKSLCPVIAGGLISRKEEVERLFQKGVLAISTSKKELW
jgi:glycerol uptake operon antiterminator